MSGVDTPVGTIAVLSAGASQFLVEVIERLRAEVGWHKLLLWSGPASHTPICVGFDVVQIAPKQFDHGGTRNVALSRARGDYLVFLSDDATPVGKEWSSVLLKEFVHDKVAAVFGRHLPREEATTGEKIFRGYCYPDFPMDSRRRAPGGRPFPISDAHGAYRVSALKAIGGFPVPCQYGEDRLVVATLLKHGWVVRYAPGAAVKHSHHTDLRAAFLRGYNIGSHPIALPIPHATITHLSAYALREFGIRGFFAAAKDFGLRWLGLRLGRIASSITAKNQ